MRDGDTDALVRQIRGYMRVYRDPPKQQESPPEATRQRMAELFMADFESLYEALSKGAPLPEVWDPVVGFRPRVKEFTGKFIYLYPPGCDGPAPCSLRARANQCVWLDAHGNRTACRRCHTIRIRMHGGQQEE